MPAARAGLLRDHCSGNTGDGGGARRLALMPSALSLIEDQRFYLLQSPVQEGKRIQNAVDQAIQNIAAKFAETGGEFNAKPVHYAGEGTVKQPQRRPVENQTRDASNTSKAVLIRSQTPAKENRKSVSRVAIQVNRRRLR